MKKLLSILLTCLVAIGAYAQEATFTASAPAQVIANQPFQITYTIKKTSKIQSSNLRAPEFTGLEHLAGPYTSTKSSTQYNNGAMTSSCTQTYTYTLKATKEGTYTIQPATITESGKKLSSNGLKIQVLPPDEDEQVTNNQQHSNASSSNISKDNLFIRTIVSRTKVKEQECISLTYKLYIDKIDVSRINNIDIPEFKDFLKQEIEIKELQIELENYNNHNYQTVTLYKTLLFPQKTGELQIAPAECEVNALDIQIVKMPSIWGGYYETPRQVSIPVQLTAPAVTINVEPLPKKPQDYSGVVGTLKMSSSLSTNQLQTNDALSIKVEISGQGNIKMLKTPTVDWPETFEVYDPIIQNDTKITSNTVTGTRSIEYIARPKSSGDYTIPPITLSYFDPQRNQYQQLTTEPFHIHVEKAAGSATQETAASTSYVTNKTDIKQLDTDIRYISNSYTTVKKSLVEFGSLVFWLCYLIPMLIAILLFIIFRKHIRENADLTKVRFRKANKVAQKRLKTAKKLMKAQQREAFYEEIERASIMYLSDRLSMPIADLNKDNITALLQAKNAPQEMIDEVINLLSEAEFARYAPSANDHQMNDLYNATCQFIDHFESELKL